MRPSEVHDKIGDLPYMTLETGQWFYDLILKHKLSKVLEIGTFHGAGSCYLGGAAQEIGGHLVTVDLPWTSTLQPEARATLRKCGIPESSCTVVRRHDGAKGYLKSYLAGEFQPLDLAYVDGGHEFDPTLTAGALALAAVRPGGWVIFDDIGSPGHPDVEACWRIFQKWPGVQVSTHGRMGVLHLEAANHG